ncbi:MAG: NAD(P)-dependent oxidoreductase [Oscillospiraceae bacterium]|nr:NAD(P)-dependent oxidoreductase [Oscillospiraceae bacterium]
MTRHIIEDAKRCIQCKTPLCSQGCPVRAPIKEAIALLLESKLLEAGKLLFENNPLSLVCGHVCTQENQCEGHCVMGKKGTPVFISAIEQYISDYYLNIYHPSPSRRTGGKTAIIGSGPAGITIAFLLAEKDYDVTIFEGYDQIGGILRYGIPDFRLPRSVVDRLTEKLIEKGVRVRPNTIVGVNLTIDDLFRDGYRAVFMGTGTWRPRKLGVRGESLGHVHFAVEYMKNPAVYRLGRSVLIIGGGNVAMDVARTAFRHGSREVTIVCRRGETSAREHDVQYAKIDGALFEFGKTPVEIVDQGVIFADTGEDRRAVPGTEKLYPADSVIIAAGQGPRSIIAASTKGLNLGESGLVAVDGYGHTSREGVFAGGDVVTGAKTVIEAVVASKRIAQAMDEYMSGKFA